MKKLIIIFLISFCFAETPQQWLKDELNLDGYSVMHYIQGNIYGRIRSSTTINGWFGLEPPSNKQIFIENLVIALAWEAYEFKVDGNWDLGEYNDYYGGGAIYKNAIDVLLSALGCTVAMRYGRLVPRSNSLTWEIKL